ncbi:hypothetical protein JCM10296v2_000964 [Rhodotorula toruloides]
MLVQVAVQPASARVEAISLVVANDVQPVQIGAASPGASGYLASQEDGEQDEAGPGLDAQLQAEQAGLPRPAQDEGSENDEDMDNDAGEAGGSADEADDGTLSKGKGKAGGFGGRKAVFKDGERSLKLHERRSIFTNQDLTDKFCSRSEHFKYEEITEARTRLVRNSLHALQFKAAELAHRTGYAVLLAAAPPDSSTSKFRAGESEIFYLSPNLRSDREPVLLGLGKSIHKTWNLTHAKADLLQKVREKTKALRSMELRAAAGDRRIKGLMAALAARGVTDAEIEEESEMMETNGEDAGGAPAALA